MTTLTLSVLMQISLLATHGNQYADAYSTSVETGRPLVVLVGADWCPGCQTMKNSVMPQLERQGSLNRVSFAYVNSDRERELAGKLMVGGSIPQLIVYRKTTTGRWVREQLTGAHSLTDTQTFLVKGTDSGPTRLTAR